MSSHCGFGKAGVVSLYQANLFTQPSPPFLCLIRTDMGVYVLCPCLHCPMHPPPPPCYAADKRKRMTNVTT